MIPSWLLWSALAVICWGLWAVVSKLIGNALTAAQSQALCTLGLAPVMIALARSRNLAAPGRRRWGSFIAFVAGVLVGLGNMAYYHALSLGGKASTVVPFTALYPLVTIVLAVVWLKERLSGWQCLGLALSLLAIALFNVDGWDGLRTGWLAYALVPVVLWGVSGLLQKISTFHLSGELSTLWFLSAFVPVGAGLLLWQPLTAPPSLRTWLLVAALGALFGLGNLALLLAFARNGQASIISSLAGLYPVVSVPVAVLFLGETVSGREWSAIAVALVSVLALSRERPAPPGPPLSPAAGSVIATDSHDLHC